MRIYKFRPGAALSFCAFFSIALLIGCRSFQSSDPLQIASQRQSPLSRTGASESPTPVPAPEASSVPISPPATASDCTPTSCEPTQIWITKELSGSLAAVGVTDLIAHLKILKSRDYPANYVDFSTLSQNGIRIALSSTPGVPPSFAIALAGKSREAFIIGKDASQQLWLVGIEPIGVRHAIYRYLRELGVRWYLPGDKWRVFTLNNPNLLTTKNIIDQPNFEFRTLFGTGGFGGALPKDPKQANAAQWNLWMARNFFSDGGPPGHVYQVFNVQEKAWLQADPRRRPCFFLATPPASSVAQPAASNDPDCKGGYRVAYSDEMKLESSNEEVIQKFVAFSVARAKASLALNPNRRTHYVSVEPSDSGGHCNCRSCQLKGNITDQVLSVANRVAQAVRSLPEVIAFEKAPGRKMRIALYAYFQHLAPPLKTRSLEPNIYITLIPYGFNYTGFSGEELIQKWHQLFPTHPKGIYSYLNLPDWSYDAPTVDIQAVANTLDLVKKSGGTGFNWESSYSGAATGAALYMTSRYLWDPSQDLAKIRSEFYSATFGPAAAVMQQLFEIHWGKNFRWSTHHLGLGYKSLGTARVLAAKYPAVLARLDDFDSYLQYLRLRLELKMSKQLPVGDPYVNNRTHVLNRHIWRMQPSGTVHSFRLAQLLAVTQNRAPLVNCAWYCAVPSIYSESIKSSLINSGQCPANAFSKESCDAQKRNTWDTVIPISAGELESWRKPGDIYQPLSIPRWTQVPVPLYLWPGTSTSQVWMQTRGTAFYLRNPNATGVPVKMSVRLIAPHDVERRLIITPVSNGLEQTQYTTALNLPISDDLVQIDLPAKPGHFVLRFQAGGTAPYFTLIPPTNAHLNRMGNYNSFGFSLQNSMYFLMPKGITQAHLLVDSVDLVKIFDSQGRPVPIRGYYGNYTIDIPIGEDGKVWKIYGSQIVNAPVEFLDIPNYFAFTPEGVMTDSAAN